ncbi:TonB-dependent receptor [Cellvibrio japonicus]|uniref:TonB-dependent receptor n=1 Tax=Cellvibrio japonicus (strain Ueda107) TaxID=498211 RepID=B3PCI9_CELJU|nr:TonB-dependent receptor [Cellvibrio japonicus]ACE84696.1 TonB-dependent receptor [Cellvibrio japonicus Ueda107]
MKPSLLCLAILAASHAALAQVQGVVRDEQGLPIAGAQVDVVGSKLRTTTNERGEFNLPQLTDEHVELHVKAPQFTHRTLHVHRGDGPVELVLASTALEVVNVIGLPWHASNMESAQPVNVLTGDKLRDRQASTLGETLKHEVGVHSSYYGPVASSPIIRGLEGPRVLVAQNGLDAGDASRVGPDHAVATEASTARQIEILRGPATLFYGSGAIGGVVNIVDDRVPQGTDTYGEWRVEHNSVADDKLVSASGNTGIGNLGLHLDGFWRDADDYKIPGPAETHADGEEEIHGKRLENSFTEAKGLNLGASLMFDDGYVGLAYGRLERQYGIPGHSHHSDEADAEEIAVYADLKQDRVQLISELNLDDPLFSAMNLRLGFTNYEHSEIEAGTPVTTFTNETREARWELFHHPLAEWRGAISFHAKHSDFSALGEEAFTPPSSTNTLALALMEERHFGSLLVQLGARIEQVKIEADNFTADLNRHDHAEGEHGEEYLSVFSVDHKSTPFSASAGVVWDFTPGYNLGISYSHAERTPSAAELLSFGPHLGSGMYEVGALLRVLEDESGDYYFDLARADLELETSNNLDISLRKFEGDFGFIINAFYNSIDNYYYLAETGATYASSHNHGDETDHGHEHSEELPVFVYQAQDADLYGFETEFIWQATAPLKLSLTSDYIRARLDEGGDLPRIPPFRIGARAEYSLGNWHAEISSQYYFEQDRIGPLETRTDGYTLLDAQVSYAFSDGLKIYLKGNNLTDEYARVHASFLKDKAPLPARAFAVGITGNF